MAWNSLPDFIRDPTSGTDCFRRLQYLKRTCSRDISASSALGVLNDYALYKSTHSLTHSLCVHVSADRSCSLTADGVHDEFGEGQVRLHETSPSTTAAPPSPGAQAPARDVSVPDDVTTSRDRRDDVSGAGAPAARSGSPSSEVEFILDSLRDCTVTYSGEFTLRRVFSLHEEELQQACQHDATGSSGLGPDHHGLVGTTQAGGLGTWTLPLAPRRPTGGKTAHLMSSAALRRLNGVTQVATSPPYNNRDCSWRLRDHGGLRLASNSVSAITPGPADTQPDQLSTSSARTDAVPSTNARAEEDQLARVEALPALGSLDRNRPRIDDALTTSCRPGDLSSTHDACSRRSAAQTRDTYVNIHKDETRSESASVSSAAAKIENVQQRESGLSATPETARGRSRTLGVVGTTGLPPVQRSSSSRDDASRAPLPPRLAPYRARSSTPCAPPRSGDAVGLTSVVASRTSSCEVLVDELEDRRLNCDLITTPRRGVTRRSSCASSCAASETDSSSVTAPWSVCDDLLDHSDDLLVADHSLLDRLLLRLHHSPSSARRPSVTRTSTVSSWSSSDDEEDLNEVDPAHRPGTVWRLPCTSLLSSLTDLASDSSDFELGSSLSQLVMTRGKTSPPPGKSTRHPGTNHDRVWSSETASCGDLSHLDQHTVHNRRPSPVNPRDWLLESHDRRPPRPAVAGTDSMSCGEVVKSSCAAAAAELTGPISESQPAQIQVATTSRIITVTDR